MTTSPREPDERFAAYVDGAMSERERERFEAELRVNPPLAAALAEYEGTVASVRAALQAATAPVDLASRVMATIAAEPRGPVAVVGHNRGYRLFVSVAAAAALLVVAVLINALAERSLPVSESMATRDAQQPEGAFDGAWLGGGTGEAGAVAVGGVGEGGVGGEPEHGLGEILGRSDSRTGFVGVVTEDDPAATNPMAFNPAVPGDNTVIVPRQAAGPEPAPRTDPDAAGADGARGVATYGSPPTTHFVPADESAAAGAAPLREQAAAGPVRSDTAPSASSGTLGQNEKAGAALEPPAAAAKVAEPAAKPVTGPPAAVGERSAGAKSGSDDFFLGAGRRKASESETPSAQTATPENPDRDGDRGVARNEQQQAVGDRRIVGITLLDKAGARPSVTLPYLQLTREFEPAPGTRYEPTDKDQARSGGDAPNARPKSRAPGYRGSGYGAPGYRGPGDAIPPPGAGAGPTTGGPTGPSAPGPAGPSSPPPAGPRTAHSGSGPATPGPASPGPSTPAGLGGKAVPDTDPEALRLRTNTRARNLRHPIRSTVSLVPFVSDQLESGDVAATAVPTVLTIGTLRCEDVTDRFAPAAPAAAGGGAAVSERFWLVEGDAAEVGELMQRLANIARENGYLLANGELGLPAPTATRSDEVAEVERAAVKAESRAEEKDAGKQRDDRPAESALATMRLVLRFRALPKSR